MTETPWDPSLVDPTAREFDGLILRTVGGRTGELTLENGQKIRFPWRAQQRIAGSVPPRMQAYEVDSPGIEHTLSLLIDGAAFVSGDSYPQVRLETTFPDDPSGLAGVRGEPTLTLRSGALPSSDFASIVLSGGAPDGLISLDGKVTISSLFSLSVGTITSAEDLTIQTTGAGDDLILDPTGALTATGSSISLVSDGNGAVTITASGSGDLSLTGSPVLINSVDVSTALGGWGNHTPTITQGAGVTATVTHSQAIKLGRLVIWSFVLATTGSGTGGNTVTVSTPYTAAAANNMDVGAGHIYNGASNVNGIWALNSTTTIALTISTGYYNTALASGHSLTGTVVYQAAA